MSDITSLGQQEWQAIEQDYQLEERIYQLTLKAIDCLKGKLAPHSVCAFALSGDSYYGDLHLAYHLYSEEDCDKDLKTAYRYPADWSNNQDEDLDKLIETEFRDLIGDKIYQLQQQNSEAQFYHDFANSYLDSLRNVAKRLEDENAFSPLVVTENFWLVVIDDDADAKGEARKLNQVRSLTVKSI